MRKHTVLLIAVTVSIPVVDFIVVLCWGGTQNRFLSGWILSGLVALYSVLARSMRTSGRVRLRWWLISLTVFFWSMGNLVMMWTERLAACPFGCAANMEDLLFMMCLIPLLLMLALPNEDDVPHMYPWLDSVPITALVFLSFLILFSEFPWNGIPLRAVNEITLNIIFLLCMFYVALFLGVRLFTEPKGENRNMTLIMAIGILANMGVYAWHNLYLIKDGKILISSPWLSSQIYPMTFLSLAALLWPLGSRPSKNLLGRPYSRTFSNINLWLLWLGPLLLAIWAVQKFPVTGSIAIVILACSYALRMALEHGKKSAELEKALQKQISYEKHVLIDVETGLPNLRGLRAQLKDRGNLELWEQEALAILYLQPMSHRNVAGPAQSRMHNSLLADSILGAADPLDAWVARLSEMEFAVIFKADSQESLTAIVEKMIYQVTLLLGHEHYKIQAGTTRIERLEEPDVTIARARRALSAMLAGGSGTVIVLQTDKRLERVK